MSSLCYTPPPVASLISKAEENSGVKFNEAQVALAREWIGDQGLGDIKEIKVQAPVAAKEGTNVSEKTEDKVPIPESFEAAKAVVEKFEHGARDVRGDEAVSDSVAQHSLEDKTSLQDEKWLGTEEEELNAYAYLDWFCEEIANTNLPPAMYLNSFISTRKS